MCLFIFLRRQRSVTPGHQGGRVHFRVWSSFVLTETNAVDPHSIEENTSCFAPDHLPSVTLTLNPHSLFFSFNIHTPHINYNITNRFRDFKTSNKMKDIWLQNEYLNITCPCKINYSYTGEDLLITQLCCRKVSPWTLTSGQSLTQIIFLQSKPRTQF